MRACSECAEANEERKQKRDAYRCSPCARGGKPCSRAVADRPGMKPLFYAWQIKELAKDNPEFEVYRYEHTFDYRTRLFRIAYPDEEPYMSVKKKQRLGATTPAVFAPPQASTSSATLQQLQTGPWLLVPPYSRAIHELLAPRKRDDGGRRLREP